LADKFERDVEAFALAAADSRIEWAADGEVFDGPQAEVFEDFFGGVGGGVIRGVGEAGCVKDVFPDGKLFYQKIILGHIPNQAADGAGLSMDVDAVEVDFAGGGLELAT
jgi:hypothetical protein